MAIERIDLANRAINVFDGSPTIVKPGMFGAIATSIWDNYFKGYSSFVDQMDTGLIRWPGGTLAENGVMTANLEVSLRPQAGAAVAYDLNYPDLLHPDLLVDSSGLPTGRPGLSEMLELAFQRGCTFSMILPTERYSGNPELAYDDVTTFLKRLFIEETFNGGRLPENIIFDIGNENYDPSSYGPVAVSILAAIRDFRTDHPTINFDCALQAMQDGSETRELLSIMQDPAYGPAYANILAEVDAVRLHNLKHSLVSVTDIEDRSPQYWAVRRMQDAIEFARSAEGKPTSPVELYVSAFTTTSNDVVQGLTAGLPGASATLSIFTGFLELGADYAATWGVAARAPAETSMSYVGSDGSLKLTPQGAVYALMSQHLVGTELIRTSTIDSARDQDYNVFAFSGSGRSVLYIAANDLASDRLDLTLDIMNSLPIQDYAVTAISARNGLSGEAVLSSRYGLLSGSTITLDLMGDYEVIEVVVSHTETLPNGQMRFIGDEGANHLIGTAWSERLQGLGGNDRLVGVAGNDTLDGGLGVDMADFGQVTMSMNVDLSRGEVRYEGNTAALISIERVITGSGINTVLGSSRNDFVIGGPKTDSIQGSLGNDRVEGRAGNDSLDGGEGSDSLYGGAGNDTLLGGIGNDLIFGEIGGDIIYAGEGNDRISGGANVDRLFGGSGADTFVFETLFGRDTVQDFDGSSGDKLDFSLLADGGRPESYADLLRHASTSGDNVIIRLDGDHMITLVNTLLNQMQADFFIF